MSIVDDAIEAGPRQGLRQSGRALRAFALSLGAGVVLGFLSFICAPPLQDFPGDWTATMFFCLGAVLVLPALPRRFAVAPAPLALPAVLAALVCVQLALGRYAYLQFPLLWLGYLALAVLAIVVGQGIRSAGHGADVTRSLAWALLAAGIFNSAVQVLQALQWGRGLAPVVIPLAEHACRPYGNVSQANHASTLAWLALAAALYLNGIGRLKVRVALPGIALLLFGSALSASRMAWLFLAVTMAVVVAVPVWPAGGARARRRLALLLAGGFAVATVAAAVLLTGIGAGCASALERLVDR
jgi:hypothetical protein